MAKIPLGEARFTNPTTAALVSCTNWGFSDANGTPDSELLSCDIDVRFNGIAENTGQRVVVARNATLAQKQAAIRIMVNTLLQATEPNVTLGNANIQIENMTA